MSCVMRYLRNLFITPPSVNMITEVNDHETVKQEREARERLTRATDNVHGIVNRVLTRASEEPRQ
jgi:hypothetical protein